jgi:chromosome partitioning protein
MILEMAYEQIFVDLFRDLDYFDYQLFDCAPSASLLTINAVAYVNEVFIPVSMEMLALSGLRQFLTYLHMIHRILDKGPTVRLVIPTFYDPRRRVSEQVMEALVKDFGSRVTQPIRIDTKLSEAPGMGQTIYEYARRSRGAVDYAKLVERVARMSLPAAG